jgi:hypothetical protein
MGLSAAGPKSPFTPNDLPGLVAWLKASASATLSAGRVVSIANEGGIGGNWVPGTNAQVPGQGLGPVYDAQGMAMGKPGLVFASAHATTLKLATSAFSGAAASLTMFAVFKPTSEVLAPGATLAAVGTTAGGSGQSADLDLVSADATTYNIYSDYFADNSDGGAAEDEDFTTISTAHTMVSIVDVSNANITLRVDGAQIDQQPLLGVLDAFTSNQITVGADTDSFFVNFGEPYYFDGVISQVLIYKGALTLTQTQQVEAWLSTQ